ncbi:arylsulfatase B-like [Babylonia areolata]|uniref:arylsulfatase B-like n=1 Tax=Babylonia areolata TaxID=304850 RepID=UPI003FD46327
MTFRTMATTPPAPLTAIIHIIIFITIISLPSSSSSSSPQSSQQPNIVFILADDYGYHDIGYHGSRIRTPNLDRLAAEGVRLENYYVQPICTPTRSQLMSGRYQIHTGLQHGIIWPWQANALPRDSPTLADKLQEAGYATHAVGKWHLGMYKDEYLPTRRGFQSYYGYLLGSEDYYTHTRCWERSCGLDLHEDTTPVWTENGTYSAYLFTQRAIDVIRRHANTARTPFSAYTGRPRDSSSDALGAGGARPAAAGSKPLFLYLAFQSVHAPLQVPEKYTEQYRDIKNRARRTYAGMVSCMDEAVGNITAALQRWGLWDNTVLVFSTDNGGQVLRGGNNWPLRGWKGSLWEGGMKGVGFVRGTRFLKGGVVHKGFMHVSDWYPTLVEGVAGGSLNGTKPLDGFNQWKSLKDGSASPRKEVLHNIDILYALHGERKSEYPEWDTRVRASLRVGDMKIITGYPGNGTWVPPPGIDEEEEEEEEEREWRRIGEKDSSLLFRSEVDKKTTPPLQPTRPRSALALQEGMDLGDVGALDAQNLWLFNITADPEERHDLSQTHPELVHMLLKKLAGYNATAVPPRYPPPDPNCDPAKHGGVWGPWE